ncbi:MAG: peptidoglycan bridge formation glycyltransferase FemA/FemB family protein, partial [Candidatus Portnoybacteria bacterium]|nr:peptidoglycan bridge formation glycyltransferase FemA/FemB family protein [Candidatus Portnoybacteria bacterium]
KTEWHDFLKSKFNWIDFEYYLYKKEAIIPFAKIGNQRISLPFCEYGGPLILKEKISFKEFNKDIKEFKDIEIKIHPKINISIDQPPQKTKPEMITYMLDLKGKNKEELLSSFRKTLKHSIRDAKKKDIEIKKCESQKELKKFYDLYVKNLKHRKTIPYPFFIFSHLYKQPETEIWIAKYKNKIISGDLFLNYNNIIHYLFGAIDHKYRNIGSNYLLLWNKLKNEAGKEKVFDFGAAPRKSSLATFKRGWRGKEYPIIKIKRAHQKMDKKKFLRSANLIRTLWKLIPTPIIKRISKKLIKYRI